MRDRHDPEDQVFQDIIKLKRGLMLFAPVGSEEPLSRYAHPKLIID
jgi:hypothetical protein